MTCVRWNCGLALAVLGVPVASAVEISSPDAPVLIDHWTMRDGLPQNSILDILEDQQGLIWVASFGGVSTFDGVRFERIGRTQYPDLEANRFLSLAQTPDGSMWLGSELHGLYRLQGGGVERVGPAGLVWDLETDHEGRLWVILDQDLYRLEGAALEPVPLGFVPHRLERMEGGLLVGGRTPSPHCVSGACGPLPEGNPDWSWSRWVPLGEDAWSVSTSAGVFLVQDGQAEQLGAFVPAERRDRVCASWAAEPWCLVGDQALPLERVREDGLPDEGPVGGAVSLVDHEGGLWVGRDGQGLYRFQRSRANSLTVGKGVYGVVTVPWGGPIFVAGGELWTPEGPLDRSVPGVPADAVHNTLFSARGEALELLRVGPRVWLIRHGAEGSELLHTQSVEGDAGAVLEGPWASLDQTLYFVEADGTLVRSVAFEALGAASGVPLRGDEQGVWVMLDRSRLVRVEQGVVVRELAWTGSTVRDLWPDGDGVYVATYGDGLVRLTEGAAPLTLGLDQGLCDEMVSHLYPVDGQLWFNSNRGLGRVPMDQLRAVVAGERETLNCTLAGSAEGNGPFGAVDAQGRIWASTVSGLAWIDPSGVLTSLMPRLRISRALHRGEPLADGAQVQGQGALSFEYRGLLYSDPKAVRYRYRLVGLDDAWSGVSGVQRVDYPALKPGSYRFEVQARGLGSWGPVERLSFERLPMWWERPGLRVGIPGLALAGLLAGLLLLWRQNERLRDHIRERVRAEAALARQQEENQRMVHEREVGRRLQALGRLAGGVAHDLNNLLTVIAVHAGLLESHSDPEVQEEGAALRDVVARGAEVTRGLLAFGQERGEQAEIVDVGHEVDNLMLILRRLIRSEVTLDVQIEPGCGAHISTGQLHQILSNLVLNARDAIQGEGVIQVRVQGHPEQVDLVVQDTGAGMSPRQLAQATEPYFTTKAPNQGSGLGLSTVRTLLEALGGAIALSSPAGGGVRVVATLPRVALAKTVPAEDLRASHDPLEVRLLIVEDRPEVLTAVAFLAKRLGCITFTADSLQAAVEVAREHPLDLVLSDVMMPGGTGPEVIRALRAVQPELPALLMSGYADVDLGEAERLTMLRKPFTRAQLREGITGVLGG